MSWCSHHPTFTSVMVYSTGLRRRVVQSVGVTAAFSAGCMMCLAWLVETFCIATSGYAGVFGLAGGDILYRHLRLC